MNSHSNGAPVAVSDQIIQAVNSSRATPSKRP
jgi:hypothetical protein